MKTYIEAIEQVADRSITPDFVRVDVTGYTDAEIQAIIQDVRDIMTGTNYTLNTHYCGHEDNAKCRFEEII